MVLGSFLLLCLVGPPLAAHLGAHLEVLSGFVGGQGSHLGVLLFCLHQKINYASVRGCKVPEVGGREKTKDHLGVMINIGSLQQASKK